MTEVRESLQQMVQKFKDGLVWKKSPTGHRRLQGLKPNPWPSRSSLVSNAAQNQSSILR